AQLAQRVMLARSLLHLQRLAQPDGIGNGDVDQVIQRAVANGLQHLPDLVLTGAIVTALKRKIVIGARVHRGLAAREWFSVDQPLILVYPSRRILLRPRGCHASGGSRASTSCSTSAARGSNRPIHRRAMRPDASMRNVSGTPMVRNWRDTASVASCRMV